MGDVKVSLINTGFLGTLGLMFIAFKLLGIIKWSWWLVLSPLWIPPATVLIVLFFILICYVIAAFFEWIFRRRYY